MIIGELIWNVPPQEVENSLLHDREQPLIRDSNSRCGLDFNNEFFSAW